MRKISIIILAILILSAAAAAGIEKVEKEEMMNYEKFSKKAAELYNEKKYDEVISLYEKALPQFPDNVFDITSVLTQLYMFKKEYEKCLDVFEYGLKRKAVYPIFPSGSYWQPLEKYDRFKKIIEENNCLRAELTAGATPIFEVLTPTDFSPAKTYPLFLVLHGWNESLQNLKQHWHSEKINADFVLVLIQSSQAASSRGFGWDDSALAKKDILEIYKQITARYPIAADKVIIGGFSQGGLTAVTIAVSNVISFAGFIALHPGGILADDLNSETVGKARQRGLRGTIIIRGQDKTVKEKMDLVKILQDAQLPYRYILSDSIHWYPADFAQQLDAAITDILEKGAATPIQK